MELNYAVRGSLIARVGMRVGPLGSAADAAVAAVAGDGTYVKLYKP